HAFCDEPVQAQAAASAASTPRSDEARRPKLIAKSCMRPRYPIDSVRAGEAGTTILLLTVGTDGQVQSASVGRSSGFKRLDDAAIDGLSNCRFEPARD